MVLSMLFWSCVKLSTWEINAFLLDILEWTKKGKDHHFIKKASTDSIQHQHLVFCKTIRSETEVAQSHLLFTLLALHTLLTCQLILPYGFSAMVTWLLECIDVLKRQNRTNKQTKRNDFMFFFGTAFYQKKNQPWANRLLIFIFR